MPRPPRIQFPGANYHIVTRGDGRRKLFHDQVHYERFTRGLETEVQRSEWIVLAYCWMPNHIHALIQTPEPNLARGMQHWLSGYANWYAKRNQRTGHLFQGRYKAFLVDDGRRPRCEIWDRGLVCRVWTAYRTWSAERNGGTRSPGSGAKMLPRLNGQLHLHTEHKAFPRAKPFPVDG